MPIITNAEIPYVRVNNRSDDPSVTPSSGYAYLYIKNNAYYIKNSSGSIIGPIASGVAALDDLSDVAITLAQKGDVLARTVAGFVNLAVGSDGEVLTADSGASTGVSWQPSSGGVDEGTQILAWLGLSSPN